jgi:hypothetical protein
MSAALPCPWRASRDAHSRAPDTHEGTEETERAERDECTERTVRIGYLANPQPVKRGWRNPRGKKALHAGRVAKPEHGEHAWVYELKGARGKASLACSRRWSRLSYHCMVMADAYCALVTNNTNQSSRVTTADPSESL